VHQELERRAAVFFAQDIGHDLIGFARVDHQRQARAARRLDVLAEDRRLNIARAEVIVEVQAAFADADDARAIRQFNQTVHGQVGIVLGLVRMDADRAPDVGVVHRQGVRRLEGRQPKVDNLSEISTISRTPAWRARSITASRSSSNWGACRLT